jgi:hypothetical protein
MDLLIWSVEPKVDQPQRKKLATTVPTLLKKITAGLTAAGVEDTARAAFFAELMKLHTAVLHTAADALEKEKILAKGAAAKPGTKPAGMATKAAALATNVNPTAAGKPGAESKPADEALDFTAPIAVKIGNDVVQVEQGDALDFTEATPAAAPAPAVDAVPREIPREVKLPSKLKEGVWVGIRSQDPDEPRTPAKLLYVSPLKSRFMFSDRRGKTVLECTRSDLAKRFRLRDLVILSESPDASLFERIINGVLGKLGHA